MRPQCTICRMGLEMIQDASGVWFYLCPCCDLNGWVLR